MSSDDLNDFFDEGDLTVTADFLAAAKNFDIAAIEELQSFLEGVHLYAKAKAILQKNEIALVGKRAALNFALMKKFQGKEKYKVPKFHEVRRSNPEEDAEDQ